jgi:hypothetical protein
MKRLPEIHAVRSRSWGSTNMSENLNLAAAPVSILQAALGARTWVVGFEAVRWMLQAALQTGGPFPPTFARCQIGAARPGTCQIAGLCAWRVATGLLLDPG